MAPGKYLERRRIAAGYSLPGLARELLALTGFATSRSLDDLHRLHLMLLSAEQGGMPHSRQRIETIRAFVPLDVSLYLHLVDCARSGDPFRVDGICAICACTFHDPCVLHVGPTAVLGASTCHWAEHNLCSVCNETMSHVTPDTFNGVGRDGPSMAEQLRTLGERMQRISREEDLRHPPTPIDQSGQQPFLRVVPVTRENA